MNRIDFVILRIANRMRLTALLCLPLCCFSMPAQAAEPGKAFTKVDEATAELTPEQVATLKALKEEKTAASHIVVKFTADAFAADATSFDMPGGAITLKRESRGELPKGFKWSGTAKGDAIESPAASAQLVSRDGNYYGQLQRGDEVFSIRPIGKGLHAVIKRDLTKLPADHPPEFDKKSHKKDEAKPDAAKPDAAKPPQATPANADSPPNTKIHVLVLYSQNVRAKHGDSVGDFIDAVVMLTNDTYSRSKVAVELELAHAAEVIYSESGSLVTDLDALMASSDGKMDHIHGLRDMHKADIVAMLITEGDYAGLAGDIRASAATAFTVLDEEYADWYFTFAHEIGHLQGARHDPHADPNESPFAFGHGYQHLGANERWRTIMAYQCSGTACPRIGHWSNPDVKYNGNPTGTVDKHNNARVLNLTANEVSHFRQ